MKIEDLRVIWDQQNEQPLYVLDQDALHASVRTRTTGIDQSVGIFERVMMGVLLFVAAMAAGKRLLTSNDLDWLDWTTVGLTIIVAIVASVSLAGARRKRLTQEIAFESTIVGDVDKAIFQLDYLFARFKTFHHWFALPMALILILRLTKTEFQLADLWSATTIQVAMMYALSMLICYGSIWFEKRCLSLPEKKSLIAIREKLVSDPQ